MSRKTHRVAELAAYKTGLLKPSGFEEEKDRYLRLAAEFDNFKKRSAKQYAEIVERAGDDLIVDLLDIVDDFERALSSGNGSGCSDEGQNFAAGIKLIYDKLLALLRSRGVQTMDLLDKPFDPVYHEAIMQIPSDKKEGTIVEVVSPGYTIRGRVIRHARVVVASSNN